MPIIRYSAVEMFGVPLEDHSVSAASDVAALKRFMESYGLDAQPIPEDVTDITPYYWDRNSFRYMLSPSGPEGAVLELLPAHDASEVTEGHFVDGAVIMTPSSVRTISIPETQEVAAITGGSPRFAGTVCIHELLIYENADQG